MLTQMNFYHNKKVKVSIENVSKTYKDIEVLKDISIDVYEGEFVSILGKVDVEKVLFLIL